MNSDQSESHHERHQGGVWLMNLREKVWSALRVTDEVI